MSIRRQYVYDKFGVKHEVHQITEVAAIPDLAAALDSYTENFIEPLIINKVLSLFKVMTKSQFMTYENPAESALFPDLIGHIVIVTDIALSNTGSMIYMVQGEDPEENTGPQTTNITNTFKIMPDGTAQPLFWIGD